MNRAITDPITVEMLTMKTPFTVREVISGHSRQVCGYLGYGPVQSPVEVHDGGGVDLGEVVGESGAVHLVGGYNQPVCNHNWSQLRTLL